MKFEIKCRFTAKVKTFGRYTVSESGDVFSLLTCGGNERDKPLRLKPRISKNGYVYYDITDGDTKRRWLGHRLVCAAFGKNIKGKVVHHKDGNRTNNALKNLSVVSAAQNVNYGRATRRALRSRRLTDWAKENDVQLPARRVIWE